MATTEKILDFGAFQYVVVIHDQIDVERVLEHLMRATALHVRLGNADDTPVVAREIKDALIKDNTINEVV